jgi:nicotinamidase-related amidase
VPKHAKNPDLHGNVPEDCAAALLLVDVINDLEFPGAERLLEPATAMAERLAALKARCAAAGIPTIYANDNYGRWRSERDAQIRHCLDDGVRGEPIVRALLPGDRDYYVVKPKHSAFYGTTLDVLLEYLGARTLIIGGLVTESCVLFTVNDAFLRDFHLIVPEDCVASQAESDRQLALDLMKRVLKAHVCRSDAIALDALLSLRT